MAPRCGAFAFSVLANLASLLTNVANTATMLPLWQFIVL